jgi:uncharacterized membrane protein YdjX (TVP38/TMEM64 family)
MAVKFRWAIFGLGVALVSLGLSLWLGARVADMLVGGAAWLRGLGPAGAGLFAAVVVIMTLVGIVPGALLGLAGGAIFGIWAGFVITGIGILLGAVAAFELSRSVFRPLIVRALRGRLAVMDHLVAADGWRLVALLRLSPIMPFSIASYALGLSGVRLADYVIGTLASLPLLLGYVVIGALGGLSLSAMGRQGADIRMGLLAFGAVATLALTVHLGRLLARVVRV